VIRSTLLISSFAVVLAASTARAEVLPDPYVEGYARGVLESQPGARATVLGVNNGVLYLDAELTLDQRERIEDQVSRIPGVVSVRWTQKDDPVLADVSANGVGGDRDLGTGFDVVPSESLFEPLVADPRWPRFSVSHLNYRRNANLSNEGEELDRVGEVNLGGTLPIFQWDAPMEGRFEFAIQGNVDSIFDIEASNQDLVSSDFFAGFPLFARWGGLSLMLRPYHLSSHIGDEFLLRDRAERVDLSLEGVDTLISIDFAEWFRIYGGGGILINRDPDTIDRRSVQAGIELASPWTFFGMRPVTYLDAKRTEENDWRTDYSAKAGFAFENPRFLRGRRLELLAEYYNGFSPNGQFFDERLEYLGGGLHFYF
jgi:hypothetical protein